MFLIPGKTSVKRDENLTFFAKSLFKQIYRRLFVLFLTSIVDDVQLAVVSSARNTAKPDKFLSAQSIQSFVSGRVLHEPGFVAEPVVTVLPHAVEMRLMLSVIAAYETAILVEPESHVAFRNRFVLQHPHRRLQTQLFLSRRQRVQIRVHQHFKINQCLDSL